MDIGTDMFHILADLVSETFQILVNLILCIFYLPIYLTTIIILIIFLLAFYLPLYISAIIISILPELIVVIVVIAVFGFTWFLFSSCFEALVKTEETHDRVRTRTRRRLTKTKD